jgi:Trypsin-like peptidase domain
VPIRRAYCSEKYADVALFVVNPKQDAPLVKSEPAVFNVTFGPPRVGEHCLALGFPQNRESIDYRLAASNGVIEEVYESRRDSAIVSYPSFRVGTRYAPAMSGGPILSTDGRVIGLPQLTTRNVKPTISRRWRKMKSVAHGPSVRIFARHGCQRLLDGQRP